MAKIKRYEMAFDSDGQCMEIDPSGDWVKFSDYAELEVTIDGLAHLVGRLRGVEELFDKLMSGQRGKSLALPCIGAGDGCGWKTCVECWQEHKGAVINGNV